MDGQTGANPVGGRPHHPALRRVAAPKTVGSSARKGEGTRRTLTRIEAGELGLAILPWLALMGGADDKDFVQRWLDVARTEPDDKQRSDYGALALVFAEAAKCRPVWKEALRGWNMIQSEQVLEWMNEGRAEGQRVEAQQMLLDLLDVRFGAVPSEVQTAVRAEQDLARLRAFHRQAAQVASLEQFRQMAQI